MQTRSSQGFGPEEHDAEEHDAETGTKVTEKKVINTRGKREEVNLEGYGTGA